MTKTYFNNAVIGNSSMLGCITDKGGLVRLFWPNIDYPQHIDKMAAGIFLTGMRNGTLWLEGGEWQHNQHYIADSNLLETVCENNSRGLRTIIKDFVMPDEDVLVRRFEIQNTGSSEVEIGLIVFSSGISTNPDMRCILFDFDCDAMVHYRHDYYISISADYEVFQFQLGNNAYECASNAVLNGYDSIGMMPDGALSWKLGKLSGSGRKIINLAVCASSTLKGVKELIRKIKNVDMGIEYNKAKQYWHDYLNNARYVSCLKKIDYPQDMDVKRDEINSLYNRSLLVFGLMSDKNTGGLLASAEIDEEFTRCGRYAYCWGRDAAFITAALDKCGLTGEVDRFYEWAVKAQDESGAWHQRYYMDGNLAPSWGLQIDETGTLIHGMYEHYKMTGSREFLLKMSESVVRGVEFLTDFIDEETGLPGPSYDLWEERLGEHTYSSAAVYAGMRAGVEIGLITGLSHTLIEKWQAAAEKMKDAIERNLWKEDIGRFLRSVRTKLNPWGEEWSSERIYIKVNGKGYCRDFTPEDSTVDVSLIGLAVPFNVFDVDDQRIVSTVEAVEGVLASPIGGIKRYENDSYIGGNPWIIAALWVALYHMRRKNFEKARAYFEWTVKSCTGLGLLPEQVDKNTGEPAWVIPLTWSHAMYVLVLAELLDAGELR